MVEQLVDLIKKYGLVFLAVAIIVTPVVWQIASSHFNERIEALKEQVALLREQKAILEEKLRQPSAMLTQAEPSHKSNSSNSPNSTSPQKTEPSRLPQIADSDRPTKDEVRELARFYGLFNRWSANPHLRFKEGDISYWSEQGMNEEELMREFESRQTVLRRAETTGEKIVSQGDLSHKAEQLQAISRTP